MGPSLSEVLYALAFWLCHAVTQLSGYARCLCNLPSTSVFGWLLPQLTTTHLQVRKGNHDRYSRKALDKIPGGCFDAVGDFVVLAPRAISFQAGLASNLGSLDSACSTVMQENIEAGVRGTQYYCSNLRLLSDVRETFKQWLS